MRTTVELPDELLVRAKQRATSTGLSLKEYFIQAIEHELTGHEKKVRRPPPLVGDSAAPPIRVLSSEEIDEVLFG